MIYDVVMVAASEIVRAARLRAGLTQSELALRCGVSQSRLSAYELGRHDPTFATLVRIVEATGHELTVRRRVDRAANADRLAQLLSFNDAVPFAARHEAAELDEPVPTFARLVERGRTKIHPAP